MRCHMHESTVGSCRSVVFFFQAGAPVGLSRGRVTARVGGYWTDLDGQMRTTCVPGMWSRQTPCAWVGGCHAVQDGFSSDAVQMQALHLDWARCRPEAVSCSCEGACAGCSGLDPDLGSRWCRNHMRGSPGAVQMQAESQQDHPHAGRHDYGLADRRVQLTLGLGSLAAYNIGTKSSKRFKEHRGLRMTAAQVCAEKRNEGFGCAKLMVCVYVLWLRWYD